MSASEASEQANRAEMDPRRLVVISYLVFGVILTMFFGRIVEQLMAVLAPNARLNGEVLGEVTGITAADLIGFAITAGLAAYAWTNAKVKGLSLEVATELMRVTWPSWDDVRTSTVAVVVASLVAAVVLFGMDTLSYKVMVDWLEPVVTGSSGSGEASAAPAKGQADTGAGKSDTGGGK